MMHEEVKAIVEEIIGDNNAIMMTHHPNGIQLEWNPKDWLRVEAVLTAVEKRLADTGYELYRRKTESHAMIVPMPEKESVATNQRRKNAKRH